MFNQQHTNDSCVIVNQIFYYGMDTPVSINRGIEIPHYRNISYIWNDRILYIENIAQQNMDILNYNKAIKSVNKHSRFIIHGQNGNSVYTVSWNLINNSIRNELIS